MTPDHESSASPTSASARDFSESAAIVELQRANHSLRTLLHLSMLCGIILSAVLFAILYKQVSVQQKQSADLMTFINDYNNTWVPQAESIRTNLITYSQTHPAITPVLHRYFGTNLAATPRAPLP